jgi:hypothetical protein
VVPQTTTPQAAVTSTFLDQLQMTTPTLSQLPSPPPQEHLSLRCQLAPLCPVRKCLHIFRVSLHHGRGFGSGGLLPACYHRADLFSDCLRPRGSRSRGHSGSDFRCRDDYSSTSSTSSGSGFLLSDLVTSQRGLRQRRCLRLLHSTFEDRLYLAAESFLSTLALDSFLVLVAKGGDR